MNSEKRYEECRKFPILFVQKKENPLNFVQQNTNTTTGGYFSMPLGVCAGKIASWDSWTYL